MEHSFSRLKNVQGGTGVGAETKTGNSDDDQIQLQLCIDVDCRVLIINTHFFQMKNTQETGPWTSALAAVVHSRVG